MDAIDTVDAIDAVDTEASTASRSEYQQHREASIHSDNSIAQRVSTASAQRATITSTEITIISNLPDWHAFFK